MPVCQLNDGNPGVVVTFAVAAAIYSIGRHFMTDKTLRLTRQNRKPEPKGGEHH